MRRSICLVIAAGALFGLAGSEAVATLESRTVAKSIHPYVTWWGDRSHVESAATFRVTSADEWKKLWAKHTGETLSTPDHVVPGPDVDFAQCLVVAVFAGKTWNTHGLTAEISDEPDRLTVRVESASLSWQGKSASEVTPYVICVLPRSEKALVIEEDDRSLKNAAPSWKELARFERL